MEGPGAGAELFIDGVRIAYTVNANRDGPTVRVLAWANVGPATLRPVNPDAGRVQRADLLSDFGPIRLGAPITVALPVLPIDVVFGDYDGAAGLGVAGWAPSNRLKTSLPLDAWPSPVSRSSSLGPRVPGTPARLPRTHVTVHGVGVRPTCRPASGDRVRRVTP